MNHEIWQRLPENFRKTAVVLFQSQGVDFEEAFISDASKTELKQEDCSPWMGRKDAAAYADVCMDTIDNWRKAGYIKDCKLADGRPGKVLIDRKSLMCHLASRVVHDPHKRIRETPMKGARYRVNSQ